MLTKATKLESFNGYEPMVELLFHFHQLSLFPPAHPFVHFLTPKVDSFNSLMTLQYVHAGITSVLLFLVLLYFPRCFHLQCLVIFIILQMMCCRLINSSANLQSHQATLQLKKELTSGETTIISCSHSMLNVKVFMF